MPLLHEGERWCERDQQFFNPTEWQHHVQLCDEHRAVTSYPKFLTARVGAPLLNPMYVNALESEVQLLKAKLQHLDALLNRHQLDY